MKILKLCIGIIIAQTGTALLAKVILPELACILISVGTIFILHSAHKP
jgi:hypothetical protein